MSFIRGKGNLIEVIFTLDREITGNFQRVAYDDPDIQQKGKDAILSTSSRHLNSSGLAPWIRTDALEDYSNKGKVVTFAGIHHSRMGTATEFEHLLHTISDPHDLATHDPALIQSVLRRFQYHKGRGMLDISDRIYHIRKQVHQMVDGQEIISFLQKNARGVQAGDPSKEGFALDDLLLEALKIRAYSDRRGVDISQSRMNLIIHQNYGDQDLLIAEHPNNPNIIHVELKDQHNLWHNKIYDKRKRFQDVSSFSYQELVLIETFVEVTEYLRKEGKLDPNAVYLAEAISRSRKIVQLRPYFKRDLQDGARYDVLGTIPEEGITFDWNPQTGRYTGIFAVDSLSDIRSYANPSLDLALGEDVQLLLAEGAHHCFLSHAGLRTIEGLTTLDRSPRSHLEYHEMRGARKIRYFEDSRRLRRFEVLEA